MMAQKSCPRHHYGVAEAGIERCAFELLCEEVGAVKLAGDVRDVHSLVGLRFADFIFAEIEMFNPFAGERCGPFDTGFVVVKNGGALDGVFY